MSDRRSFSEIPAELLGESATDARVERIWSRLENTLQAGRARRRPSMAHALGLAALTFVCGAFVGARWLSSNPAPVALMTAEPLPAVRSPSALAARPFRQTESAKPEAPRGRQIHRSAPVRQTDVATAEPEPAPPASSQAAPAPWQRLADEGQYVQALASLEASGGFDAALRDATADELMSLVDVARATGQRDRAIVALRRIVSEHGTDPNAPVAAWMLGNELAKTGSFPEAEQAFAMYRALSPNGDFAEDALARQIDMAAEQGNLEHAKKLADQYLKEFPDGPRSADIELELERWGQKPASSASAEAETRASDTPPAASAEPAPR